MTHFLCFTDLASTGNSPNRSASENQSSTSINADSFTQSSDAPALVQEGGEIDQHPTALFVREENKKSSFVLQQPFLLLNTSENKLHNGDSVPNLSPPVDSNTDLDEVDGKATDVQKNHKNEAEKLVGKHANIGGKTSLSATASISSCISSESPKFIPQAQEMFLFGGFELITNVKTVEVHVTRTSKPGEESYLTTCKGIPMRDLPHLATTPLHVDGTRMEGESTIIGNHDDNLCKIKESQGIKNAHDDGTAKTKERDVFYKFIFVSPGGPKPMERVRLKFVRSNGVFERANSIIVRTLKVKGRLSDSIPPSRASQQSTPQPFSTANLNPGIPNTKRKGNTNNLASMMAMMGGNGMMGMPMAMQMSPQHQQLNQLPMQSPQQQYAQQQQQHQNNQQQEKNQAEIISSVAGLGMFLKHSEERTMNKLETMLTNMETRIMTRLDGLAQRLDAIEHHNHAEAMTAPGGGGDAAAQGAGSGGSKTAAGPNSHPLTASAGGGDGKTSLTAGGIAATCAVGSGGDNGYVTDGSDGGNATVIDSSDGDSAPAAPTIDSGTRPTTSATGDVGQTASCVDN